MQLARSMRQAFALATLIAVVITVHWICLDRFSYGPHRTTAYQLQRIANALKQYHKIHGRLPPSFIAGPNGEPWHSWRTLILPQLGYDVIYSQYRFDEPWNSPHNLKLVEKEPAEFAYVASGEEKKGSTSFLAIVGTEAIWQERSAISVFDIQGIRVGKLLVAECANSNIAWTEPRDIKFSEFIGEEPGLRASSNRLNNNFQRTSSIFGVTAAFTVISVSSLDDTSLNLAERQRNLYKFASKEDN